MGADVVPNPYLAVVAYHIPQADARQGKFLALNKEPLMLLEKPLFVV